MERQISIGCYNYPIRFEIPKDIFVRRSLDLYAGRGSRVEQTERFQPDLCILRFLTAVSERINLHRYHRGLIIRQLDSRISVFRAGKSRDLTGGDVENMDTSGVMRPMMQ